VQDFHLYASLQRVDVRVTVDWREQFKLLKLRFPVNLHYHKITYEIPYGVIERGGDGTEEPGQSWVDLSGTARDSGDRYGLSLINDGKYSFDVNVRDLGLTAVRSPIYAHHIPAVPRADGLYSFVDQGLQRFTYGLFPHAGSWEAAGTIRAAAELNQPPIALLATSHAGPLPQRQAFVEVESDGVLVSAIKQAEDGDDLIVRAYEAARRQARAVIRFPHWGREIMAQFGPAEIKTFRVPRDRGQPIRETDLLEWTD
jgi:alpha-mannosidase